MGVWRGAVVCVESMRCKREVRAVGVCCKGWGEEAGGHQREKGGRSWQCSPPALQPRSCQSFDPYPSHTAESAAAQITTQPHRNQTPDRLHAHTHPPKHQPKHPPRRRTCPSSSAFLPAYAPGVSTKVTMGKPNLSAWRMKRRALR